MKIPKWIKDYWKDPVFKVFSIAVPIVCVVWDILCTATNYIIGDPEISFGTSILGLAVLTIMYALAYFKRSDP